MSGSSDSAGNGDSTSDQASPTPTSTTTQLFENKPWVWVVLPLLCVIIVGTLAIIVRMRRTQRRRAALASLDPRARAELERRLGALWPVGDATAPPSSRVPLPRAYAGVRGGVGIGHSPSAAGGQQRPANSASRWAWASNFAAVSRAEEGLNELGEAPPPYMGKKREEEGGGGGGNEAHQLQELPSTHARLLSGGGGADGVGAVARVTPEPLPPAYTEGPRPVVGRADSSSSPPPEIMTPGRVAMPPERSS